MTKERTDVTKRLDDREFQLEMMKIQICIDRVHANFTTYLSFLLALLVGGLVLTLTIRYENISSAEIISPSLMALFLVVIIVGVYFINRNYTKDLKAISKMIETLKEGKELQPLSDIELPSDPKNKNKKLPKAEIQKLT
jgi:Ni,Fe-hydrogenase I large subunit